MTLERYFQILLNILERHWSIVDHETVFEILAHEEGHITSRVHFLDESYLDFEENVHVVANEIQFGYYKYQYVRDQKPVIRYDSFPFHPGVSLPYHHKHPAEGRPVVQLNQKPKLIEVIEEITHLF